MSTFSNIVNLQSPDTSITPALFDPVPNTDKPTHYRLLPKSMLDDLSFRSSARNDDKLCRSAYFKDRSPGKKVYGNSESRASPLKPRN